MNPRLAALAAILALSPLAARAQSIAEQVKSTPLPCGAGTGTPVTSVGTTATPVCAAAPGGTGRTYFLVTANGGTAGNVALECTYDGTAPSATHYQFSVFAQLSYDSSGNVFVPQGAVSCISATGSAVPVTAMVLGQGGNP